MIGNFLSSLLGRRDAELPLATEHGVRACIAGLDPRNAETYLDDITQYLAQLDDVARTASPRQALRAAALLDQCAHTARGELLYRFLSPDFGHHLGEIIWHRLDEHLAALLAGYRPGLTATLSPAATASFPDKAEAARSAAAFFHAWGLRIKLHRLRYRPPSEDLWREGHALYAQLVALKIARLASVPFWGDDPVTPEQMYLRAIFFDCLPVENLSPQQMEVLDAFLARTPPPGFADKPSEETTHVINPDSGSRPYRFSGRESMPRNAMLLDARRYCPALMTLADALAADREIPGWLFLIPGGDDQKEAALRLAAHYWSTFRINREENRFPQEVGLHVVFGFQAVVTMTRITQAVREYRQHSSTPPFLVSPDDGADWESSFDMLHRLEAGAKDCRPDIWRNVDASDKSIGVTVPLITARYHVGNLIAFRFEDGIEWRIGVIRRIGRTEELRPHLGIEVIGTEPWVEEVIAPDPANPGNLQRDTDRTVPVVHLSPDGNVLLAKHGALRAGQPCEALGPEGPYRITPAKLIDSGSCYQRFRCTTDQSMEAAAILLHDSDPLTPVSVAA